MLELQSREAGVPAPVVSYDHLCQSEATHPIFSFFFPPSPQSVLLARQPSPPHRSRKGASNRRRKQRHAPRDPLRTLLNPRSRQSAGHLCALTRNAQGNLSPWAEDAGARPAAMRTSRLSVPSSSIYCSCSTSYSG